MHRYKEKSRESREDREDRRRHDRKRKGREQDNEFEGNWPNDRERGRDGERMRGTMTHSSRNEREDRGDKYDKSDRPSRNDRNEGNERNVRRKYSHQDSGAQKEASPEWGRRNPKEEPEKKAIEKDKPNFGLSGKLTEDANTVNGVVIKYSEPQDARKPKRRWRLYPFKGEKTLPTLYVHRQSAYLMGRDRKVADIPLDHPSCSKQHAALQYRLVTFQREDGGEGKRLRPYLIDLDSANGTFVNDVKLEPKRYYELLERDVLKFGFSSREYVLLHEQSSDGALDDDVPVASTAEAQ